MRGLKSVIFQSFMRKPLKQGDPELSHLLTKAVRGSVDSCDDDDGDSCGGGVASGWRWL